MTTPETPNQNSRSRDAQQAPERSPQRWLRTGVGCLTLLWLFPGMLIGILGTGAISGDQPTPSSSQEATLFFVAYVIGLISLPVLWLYLRRHR